MSSTSSILYYFFREQAIKEMHDYSTTLEPGTGYDYPGVCNRISTTVRLSNLME